MEKDFKSGEVEMMLKKIQKYASFFLIVVPIAFTAGNAYAQMGGMGGGGMGGGQTPQPMPNGVPDIPPAPSLQEQFENSVVTKSDYDLRLFRYIPRGAILVRQPEHRRVLFQDKDHHSLGYAQQKGAAIFYYDGQGKITNVQRLSPEEMEEIF
ncbi:hypothetical protein FAI40_07035 [Acetobacteraceae bacterium]|nr:hypothetical protein FAI40_07035 [Acetobacteraceae bacterium]